MAEDEVEVAVDPKRRQMRLMGVGSIVAGLVTVGAGAVSADPYGPLVGVFGFLGIAAMVFEYTEGIRRGVSMGFLVSGILVWLYPVVVPPSAGSPSFLGTLLTMAGVFNVGFAPLADRLRAFGARLGSDEDAEEA
jgi:uncharacterized membrane protein HdeD (DUF308 family)